MIKRAADWLEKMSAGSILIGMFQDNMFATLVGLMFFGLSEFLTWRGDQ